MKNYIKELIEKTKNCYPKSFVDESNVMIISKNDRVGFQLNNIENELEYDCKILEWCTYPALKCKGNYYTLGINKWFDRKFTKQELFLISNYLGKGYNRETCKKYIQSNFDRNILIDMDTIEIQKEILEYKNKEKLTEKETMNLFLEYVEKNYSRTTLSKFFKNMNRARDKYIIFLCDKITNNTLGESL